MTTAQSDLPHLVQSTQVFVSGSTELATADPSHGAGLHLQEEAWHTQPG